MIHITADQLKDMLLKGGLIGAKGFSGFQLLGLSTNGNSKSLVGYMFQEWLEVWMENNKIYHDSPENSQESPDFFLSEIKSKNLLEIKTFDYSASPNFDVANYEAYCTSLLSQPYRIDADYLIFGYSLENAEFSVKEVWLKKVWEITGPMQDFPIRIQRKKDMIYNIRPMTWYSMGCRYNPFNTKEDFINALQNSLLAYNKTSSDLALNWKNKFEMAYSNWEKGVIE